MSVLDKTVSYFQSITSTAQGRKVKLDTLLKTDKFKIDVLKLRQSDKEQQKQLKIKLPCYTVAGTFRRRSNEGLIQLSGLAAVDLDSAGDYDIPNLLNQLKKINWIAYAGLSCRGQRLFCIVPFKYPDKYERHYEALIKTFESGGLPMGDDCHKIISQPRFVSWNDDSTQFFNHNAKPYELLAKEKKYYTIKISPSSEIGNRPKNAFQWCVDQINKNHSFREGERHHYIFHLARYCNLKGLSESETLQGCLGYSLTDFTETEINKIVTYIYSKQSNSHNKFPFKKYKPALKGKPYREKAVQQSEKHFSRDSKRIKEKKCEIKKITTLPLKKDDSNDFLNEEYKIPEELICSKSFIGKSEKFYVQNPVHEDRWDVYRDQEAYKSHKEIPYEVMEEEAFRDFESWVIE